MGIYAHRFYFKKGLPKAHQVKKKFKELTGLGLNYKAYLYIDELMTDIDDIIYHLENPKEESNRVSINRPHFYCGEEFKTIYLEEYMDPASKSFYIECGIGTPQSMYSFYAMIKSMHELGGNTLKHTYASQEELEKNIDQYIEPYHPHEREWKRIKKWREMSDFEKEGFKDKHA